MTATETTLLALVEDVIGLTDLDEFRVGLLEALRRAVPSEYASLNDLGSAPGDTAVISLPALADTPELLDAFARHKGQNPIAQHHARTRDGRAYRFSDLTTRRELHRLALYREVYAPLGIEYQIAFTLPTSPDRLLAVALSRAHRDYTSSERELLNRARPILIQAFRNAVEQHQLRVALARLRDGSAIAEPLIDAGLTKREAQIMQHLARGHSKRDIAIELNISQRTVGKHLERCFKKLEVKTQSAAAAKAWALTP